MLILCGFEGCRGGIFPTPTGIFPPRRGLSLSSWYENLQGFIGYPLLYSCRTLTGRPHKKPPMGSRSACFNAVD